MGLTTIINFIHVYVFSIHFYIFISKKCIYIFDDYKNWNVHIRRKESLFDLLKARYFLYFFKNRYFSSILKESKNFFLKVDHRISKNNNIDKNWTNINERIFFRKKSYSPIITNSTCFIHASLIDSLWTFDISNFLECNGWKWWLRKALKANIFFVGI